jgi:cobalt-zinc-cadmium efflux system outer membrane protein
MMDMGTKNTGQHWRSLGRIAWRVPILGGLLPFVLMLAGCSTLSRVYPWAGSALDDSRSQSVSGQTQPEKVQASHAVVPVSHETSKPAEHGVIQVRLGGPQPIGQGPESDDRPGGNKAAGTDLETLPEAQPISAEALTLDQAISITLIADPKIRAGLEAINQANADLLTSSLLPNPTLLTDALLLPLQRWTPERTGGPPQMDVLLSYPIDWFLFGKRVATMASAAAGVRVSEADYANLVRQRVTETAVAFFDVQEAAALLDLARKDLENLQKVLAATEKAVQKGVGGLPPIQLKRVRLDVLKSQQTLREAQLNLAEAEARLLARLGRKEAQATITLDGNLDAPLTVEPLPIANALALAEENRPDIISLRLQIDKAARDIRTEKTKACPQVTPMVGYTRQFQEQALGQLDADSLNASITITLPLCDRNQGNIAKARSVFAQNSLNLETGLVDLRSEIVQVVREFETAHKTAQAVAAEQLKTAKEVLDGITKSYEAGGSTLLEVLDAQRNYRETHRLYYTSRANYWRSVYRFKSAIGQWGPQHE